MVAILYGIVIKVFNNGKMSREFNQNNVKITA